MKTLLAIVAVLSLGSEVFAQAPEQPADTPQPVQVDRIALGTGLESRELVGEAAEFDASVGRVYCWTKIMSQTVPTTIKHVWYAGEEKAAEVPLTVQYPATRTWSSKAIWAGQWRVDVVSETGAVLASIDLTVKPAPGPSGP